jgi:type IV secretory pathway VirB10-like protein
LWRSSSWRISLEWRWGQHTGGASGSEADDLNQAAERCFCDAESGEAGYLKGMDRNKNSQSGEDMVLGQANGLASDAYEEAEGVPKKTQAQEDAEHGRNGGSHNAPKSEAEQQKEKAALETGHRRQNDLDASPLSVDFSSYFEREKQPSAVSSGPAHTEVAPELPAAQRRSAFSAALAEEGQGTEVEATASKNKKEVHDPQEDYAFDSSFGKLYRLMEDTLIETVLVNRLSGASVGPVITMVATDVFSENGSHLLIPKGTRLLGRISAVGSVSQERLFVAFHRMIMPDGYSVSLDKFQGLDVVGRAGLRDLVNHHYFQIFGASLALAAVSATTQIGGPPLSGVLRACDQSGDGEDFPLWIASAGGGDKCRATPVCTPAARECRSPV